MKAMLPKGVTEIGPPPTGGGTGAIVPKRRCPVRDQSSISENECSYVWLCERHGCALLALRARS